MERFPGNISNWLMRAVLLVSVLAVQAMPQGSLFLQRDAQLHQGQVISGSTLTIPVEKEKKSPMIALLLSAALPGMGEWYAGDFGSGKYFTIAELSLWGAYYGVNTYGEWQRNNYKTFAVSSGGVSTGDKDGDFYANIGNYKDIVQYNDEMALQGRFSAMYNPATHYWQWQSTAERKNYRTMWTSSQVAFNNLRFVTGGMLLNRLVSIINAMRLTAAHNRSLEEENKLTLSVGAGRLPDNSSGMQVTLIAGF